MQDRKPPKHVRMYEQFAQTHKFRFPLKYTCYALASARWMRNEMSNQLDWSVCTWNNIQVNGSAVRSDCNSMRYDLKRRCSRSSSSYQWMDIIRWRAGTALSFDAWKCLNQLQFCWFAKPQRHERNGNSENEWKNVGKSGDFMRRISSSRKSV